VNVAGLTYKGLRDIRAAQYEPFEPWFDSQSEYSRQPYEQLAQIFQTFGMSEKAAEIRYADRDRERRDTATGWWHWAGSRVSNGRSATATIRCSLSPGPWG